MSKIFKIGYIAPRSGVISIDEQEAKLKEFGCEVIYTAEDTVFEAIKSLRDTSGLLVVWSTAVIGRHGYPKAMAELAKTGCNIYNLRTDQLFNCRDGKDFKAAWDDITKAEKRTSAKAGAKRKYDAEKIATLHSEGYNQTEIAKIVGASAPTVGRYLARQNQ